MAIVEITPNTVLPARATYDMPVQYSASTTSFMWFDPMTLIICMVLLALLKKKAWAVPIVALACAFLSETALTVMQYTRSWGDGFFFQLVKAFVYTLLAFGIFKAKAWMQRRKPEMQDIDET